MLPNKTNICSHFNLALMKAMPLRALSPTAKLLSSANTWSITNKTNQQWGVAATTRAFGVSELPFASFLDRTQKQRCAGSGNKDQVWLLKKHVGNTKEKHNQKTSTENPTQAVVLLSSWNHNYTKCHKPVPSHGKELETFCDSFLIQSFLNLVSLEQLSICFRTDHLY